AALDENVVGPQTNVRRVEQGRLALGRRLGGLRRGVRLVGERLAELSQAGDGLGSLFLLAVDVALEALACRIVGAAAGGSCGRRRGASTTTATATPPATAASCARWRGCAVANLGELFLPSLDLAIGIRHFGLQPAHLGIAVGLDAG